MKTALFILILLLGCLSLGANIFRVALDGSQPYTIIQEAINASADTDTVLVYPGRYYENIRFYGKNITLASLELTTGSLDYKYNTILDGNQNGSVIQIRNGESFVTIRGFTITNGSGFYDSNSDRSYGGGILIGALSTTNSVNIVSCDIVRNNAGSGGGIQVDRCNLFLSGTSIRNNVSNSGGGIKLAYSFSIQYSTTFDPVNRCSIYNNKAAFGCDLYFYLVNQVHVVVDTFTVANPSNFYASAIPQDSNITNPYTFDILHSVHTEVNHDLFVAPWGVDTNDGLSQVTPLKTIFMAVYNIASDSQNPKTIYLAAGLYSKSLNNQQFPVPMKSWTRLSGTSMNEVTLDVENTSSAFSISPFCNDLRISNLSLQNCRSGIGTSQSSNIETYQVSISQVYDIQSAAGFNGYENEGHSLKDIIITDINSQGLSYGIKIHQISGTTSLKNVDIRNVRAVGSIVACDISSQGISSVVIDGCKIHNNTNSSSDSYNSILQIAPFDIYGQSLRIVILNSAFYDNHQNMAAHMGYIYALNDTAFVRNCTFSGNTGGSSTLIAQGNVEFTNNVFWNPQLSREIDVFYSSSSGIIGRAEFNNNCIRNGQNGIYNMSPLNEIIWHNNNLSADPLFELLGNHPYRLSSFSPLIDIGLQSLFLEPGTDAGGNERVWDGDGDGVAIIDIGAYEYQPIFSPTNLTAQLWQQQIELSWEMPAMDRCLSGYRIYRNNLPYAELNDPSLVQFRDYSPVNDTLTYYVVALYGSVESAASNTVTVIVSGVESTDETLVPATLNLSISPNPFSDLAVIRYNLPKASEVTMQIYNLKGQLVRTVISETQSKGEQLAVWEGCDEAGRHLASGIYFLCMNIDGKQEKPRRLVLLK